MKVKLAVGAAAIALAGVAPAVAQQTHEPNREKIHTRAEVQAKVAEHFAKLDADRDGFVTRSEADSARGKMRAARAERRGDRLERRFERMDSNNDGSISRSEFDSAHAQRLARRGEAGERRMHRVARRVMRGHFGGRMFAMADANGDQRVSLAEATAAALRHFDMADTNRDGRITSEERRQIHQRMISERRPG